MSGGGQHPWNNDWGGWHVAQWAVGVELGGGRCEESLESCDVLGWGYNAFEGGGVVDNGLHEFVAGVRVGLVMCLC